MGALTQLVSRFAGGGRRTRRPAGGAMGHTGGTGAAGGTRAQDEAIGRGVRSLLGRFRR
jgi:hypothetical protein